MLNQHIFFLKHQLIILRVCKLETPQHPAYSCQRSPERTLKMTKNLPKIAPDTDVFVHSQGSVGDPQVVNTSNLIVLIQHRVVGLRMLSAGQNLAVLRPNLCLTRPHIAISEHFLTAHNR